jgi:hypothetical protein
VLPRDEAKAKEESELMSKIGLNDPEAAKSSLLVRFAFANTCLA